MTSGTQPMRGVSPPGDQVEMLSQDRANPSQLRARSPDISRHQHSTSEGSFTGCRQREPLITVFAKRLISPRKFAFRAFDM